MPHRALHQAAAGVAGRPTTPTTPEPEEPLFDGKYRPVYQNTYRLESQRPWSEEAVLACLRDVMQEQLANAEYDPAKCSELACSVATAVRARVRELNLDRYKIVCVVDLGEKLFQGLHSKMGYLWDVQRDHYASYSFSNTRIVATGTVYGIYYE